MSGIDKQHTLLMLHMDDRSFKDEMGNAVTVNGCTLDDGRFNKGCSFNGSSNYLLIKTTDKFDLGTNDFTVDFWIKYDGNNSYTGNTSHPTILHANHTSGWTSGVIDIVIDTTDWKNQIGITSYDDNKCCFVSFPTELYGQLVHVAFVRYNGVITVYLNGKKQSYTFSNGSLNFNLNKSGYILIGRKGINDSNYLKGIVDELRISDIARWTQNFTPPVIEYSINGFLIKQDGNYYTILPDTYDTVTKMYKPIISFTKDNFCNYQFNQYDMFKEITIGDETFRPIDKFNKFKLVSDTQFNEISLRAIKSQKELIVASNNFSTKISNRIDYFKTIYEKDANSNIKLAFSIDNGVTWKGNNFENLSIEIPIKPYPELTEEEKTKWDNAKEIISINGISAEDLESLDFNTLECEYIRFAYVLSVTSADDICNTSKLQWQFDAKGSMQLMDSTEIGIEVLSDTIKVTPKVETELIKVNITNGNVINMLNTIQVVDTLPSPSKEIKNNIYFLQNDENLYKCIENNNNYIMKNISIVENINIQESTTNTESNYKLDIIKPDGSKFTTANLRGVDNVQTPLNGFYTLHIENGSLILECEDDATPPPLALEMINKEQCLTYTIDGTIQGTLIS